MIEAAAVPETFFTIWPNIMDRGRLAPGDTILIHGGASGIGSSAIQLAKVFGARVIVTAGSSAKCEACRRLGADVAINYLHQDFVAEVKSVTGGKGADIILDMVGGDYVNRNYDAAAEEARIVQIAVQEGAEATVDMRRLMVKRLTHTGSTLRPRSVAFKASVAETLHQRLWPLLESRRIVPFTGPTYPLARAADAHRQMDAGDHVGRIVLTVE
jgi:NADPH2:quinone reductase